MVSRVNSEYPTRMQHNHEMRYAIASVAHAMMISDCEDPSKIMGGLHPLSLLFKFCSIFGPAQSHHFAAKYVLFGPKMS